MHEMNRRELLGSAGVTLSTFAAGCLDPGDILGSTRSERELSLTGVDEVGTAHPLRLGVNLQSRAMGAQETPSLEITLESTTEEALFIGYREFWPEDALSPDRDSDPPALRLLADLEFSELTVEKKACPVTTYSPTRAGQSTGHRVTPDKQYRVQYFVVGVAHHLTEGCPTPGHYRFSSQYSYTSASEVEQLGWENADRQQFTWGFSLTVADATE